jgi:hypothetical protein
LHDSRFPALSAFRSKSDRATDLCRGNVTGQMIQPSYIRAIRIHRYLPVNEGTRTLIPMAGASVQCAAVGSVPEFPLGVVDVYL